MALDSVKNFAKGTLNTGIAAGATSIVLAAGDGAKFPAPATDGAFNAVIWNASDYADPSDDPSVEIVRVTARSSDTLTVTRAQEGTSDVAHNAAGKTYKMLLGVTKKMMDDLQSGLGTMVTPSGTVNGVNTVFTVASQPKWVLSDAGGYVENNGYTYSGGTITMSVPPSVFIRAFL